jgi:hypothetical protein
MSSYIIVCNRLIIANRDGYFLVSFEKASFFEAARALANIIASLKKQNYRKQI